MPIGQPKPAITPRASDVIGPRPVVQQASTDRLADAFHKGFIQTDDIINRIDKRAQAKRKAEQQYYEEQMSPEATEARQAIQQMQKVKAQEEAQRATTELELGDVNKDIRRNEQLWKLANSQEGGTLDTMQAAFTVAGVPMPMKQDLQTGGVIPDVDAARNQFREVQEFAQFKKSLNERFTGIQQGKFTDEAGNETVNWLDAAELSTPQEAGVIRERIKPMLNLTFDQWKALNRPQDSNQLFGAAPGQVTTPTAPTTAVPAAPAAVAPASPLVTPAARSTVSPAPVPAPTLQAGARGPGGGIVTKAIGAGGQRPQEVQIRAQVALPRFVQSNRAFEELEAEGYDPASIWNTIVRTWVPEWMKSGDVKQYEAAAAAWTQGVLRFESGAALTKHEEEWYRDTFFPKVSDPKSIQDYKNSLRADMERVVSEVATAGGSAGPEVQDLAQKVIARAEKLAGWSGQAGSQNPETLGYEKYLNPETGTAVWMDPKTGTFLQVKASAPQAAPARAPGSVQPRLDSLSTSGSVVEPLTDMMGRGRAF